MKKKIRNLFIGLAIVLLACLGLIYSGIIGVSASGAGGGFTDWLFRTVVTASVESGAEAVEAPDLSGDGRLRDGAELYRENCAGCHGSPGAAPADFARGLHPRPPELADRAGRWSTGELFWITKHGIRMTGMPAWGRTLDDDAIWAIVAAARAMPDMSASDWRKLVPQEASSAVDAGEQAPERAPEAGEGEEPAPDEVEEAGPEPETDSG